MVDDLVSPLRVVSLRDEAIDWPAMWSAAGVTPRLYAETRDEESVRVLPGMAPRWCALRPLSAAEGMAADSAPGDAARFYSAFRVGVEEIQSFVATGIALRPTFPAPAPNGGTRMIWSDADMQRIAGTMGLRFIYEIGLIILERALEGNVRSGGVLFTLPLFLQPELDRIARLLVAHERESAGTRSSDRSAPAAPTKSSQSSAAATAAHAENGDAPPAAKVPTTFRATPASSSSSRSKKRRARG